MSEILNVIFRTILTIIILFFITKLIGKKQISQLSLFDYIVGITVGSIAADISLDIEKGLIIGIISLLIYGVLAYLISLLTMKSMLARRFLVGVPTVLVENSKIIESGLKKTKIDVNELLAEARTAGYFNLDEIEYAVMEINGSISFMPKDIEKPVTKKDMKVQTEKTSLTANVIIDGKYMEKNMEAINKTKKWLDGQLKVQGYNNYNDILLATVDENYKVTVYRKNVKPDKNTILE